MVTEYVSALAANATKHDAKNKNTFFIIHNFKL